MGRPMIEHVYRRTLLCQSLEAVYIATCDEEIREAVQAFGAPVIMTSPTHRRAAERVAEAATKVEADIVALVQADEPMVVPEIIDATIAPVLEDEAVGCTNLVTRLESEEEYQDPNTVKVVMGPNRDAMYFSRSPIPWVSGLASDRTPAFKQVGIFSYRRDRLLKYATLEPTPLERAESVDQLRFLEHGYKIRLVETAVYTHSVDVKSDLELVESLMAKDPITAAYLESLTP